MDKYVDIKSPFTGGRVKEISTTEEMDYHGHKYTVHVRYYQCEDTGEKFTTTEQDQEWYDELHHKATEYQIPETNPAFVADNTPLTSK